MARPCKILSGAVREMRSRFRLLSGSEHFALWSGALMALASPVVFIGDRLWGVLDLLIFGGSCAVVVVDWRQRADDEVVAEVGALARPLARNDVAGYRRLIEMVAPLRGRQAAGALAELSRCARLMDGLFHHAGRREIGGFPEVRDVPLSWALASLHEDGHVREAAVAEMGRAPRPEFIPFLVERAVERVSVVRSVAGRPAGDAERRVLPRTCARSFSRVAGRRRAQELAELLAPGSGERGLGRCTERAFVLCGRGVGRCAVDELNGSGPSLAPLCCGRARSEFGQPCPFVIRQRRRWARQPSGGRPARA